MGALKGRFGKSGIDLGDIDFSSQRKADQIEREVKKKIDAELPSGRCCFVKVIERSPTVVSVRVCDEGSEPPPNWWISEEDE